MQRHSELILIGVPLGNYGDITYRAVETINSLEYVFCEDTREFKKMCAILKIDIPKNVFSYREQNHDKAVLNILSILQADNNVGYVSDAGMPVISDPGYRLVKEVREAGFNVTSTPGATSITTAIAIAGVKMDKFLYVGFLPKKKGKLKRDLEEFLDLDIPLVALESPYRVQKLLEVLKDIDDDLNVHLVKDLTKKYEEVIIGSPTLLLDSIDFDKLKGEFVVIISQEN